MASREQNEALRPFLKSVTTVADAERALELDAWTEDGLARWKRFKSALRPEDRLWFFRHFSPPRTGFGGYVIECDGVLCESIVTERY
jgi:hypothetical protein